MHVADEVDQVPYRLGALQGVGRLVLQDGALLLDRARHTALAAAVLVQRALMLPEGNIDVVPWAVVAFIAHIIRPCGRIHHQIHRRVAAPALELRVDGTIGEDLLHHLPRFRSEAFFRDQSYRLMTLAAPGMTGRSR